MVLEYWFMSPVVFLVATTAIALGVRGATFFAPILIVLGIVISTVPGVVIGGQFGAGAANRIHRIRMIFYSKI